MPSHSDEFQREPDLPALSMAHQLLKKDPDRALSMLEELANRGSLMSMVYLGDAYLRGVGVTTDIEAAKKWLRRATDEGSHVAPHQLGLLYFNLKEYHDAEEMFRLGTSWNYLPSLYRLGTMYEDGVGVTRQAAFAREFFERASSEGHVFAKRRLAGLLLRGQGGSANILRGLWLFALGLAEAVVGAVSDPESERMRS